MDKALFDQHVKHFSQAKIEGTPFTKNLLKGLGKYIKTALGKLFHTISKSVPKLHVDKYTTEFLNELKRTSDDIPEIDMEITKETVQKNSKNWKESTSTLSEGRNNIALPRWLTVHNLYLQKQNGNFKTHRLRTIHKVESEVNLMRQDVIARRLMTNAESTITWIMISITAEMVGMLLI
eukprot:4811504-Ditylum_brightwellii.AAC.2